MGVMDDVTRRTPSGWAPEHDGQAIYLLGTTRDELDGSEWARFKGHLGGQPPKVDLALERQLGDMLVNMSRDGMIDAAHDVSAGGLAATCRRLACVSTPVPALVWVRLLSVTAWTCSPCCSRSP